MQDLVAWGGACSSGSWGPLDCHSTPPPAPQSCKVRTQPEFPGDVPKAVGVFLPVSPEVRLSIHAALEHLETRQGSVSLWLLASAPGYTAVTHGEPTSQPPPSVSMSQNTSKGRSRLPLRKMVVVFEALAPFCSSSPQSRGKGIRSPPVERRGRVCLFSPPDLRPQLRP